MNNNKKYILLGVVLVILSFELYINIFLKKEVNISVPVSVREIKEISINEIYEEIIVIDGLNILESKLTEDYLVTKINIKGNRGEVKENLNLLNNYRILDFKITIKDEIIDLSMDIVKK